MCILESATSTKRMSELRVRVVLASNQTVASVILVPVPMIMNTMVLAINIGSTSIGLKCAAGYDRPTSATTLSAHTTFTVGCAISTCSTSPLLGAAEEFGHLVDTAIMTYSE